MADAKPKPDDVELLINGQAYAGWESASVTTAMDACAGAFNLTVSDRWSGRDQPWEIGPGDAAEIRVGGEVLITGYVDAVRPDFSADAHSITVQGRDKSGDLVDCSAVHAPDEWKSIGLLALAQALCAPFGITVKAEIDLGAPLTLVKLQHGETVLEAIGRYAKMRKALVMPDGKGGILLTRASSQAATARLVQGENILSASGELDWSERFSSYIVKGQAGYKAETDGETEAHTMATASDPGVTRYRPLIIIADTEATNATAKDRATYEANSRLGQATKGKVTVQGWRQTEGGPLWKPNQLVMVRSAWLQVDGEMLIRQVTFNKSSSGTTTELDIVSPQAYAPEPPDSAKSKKKKKGKKGKGDAWEAAIGEEVRDA